MHRNNERLIGLDIIRGLAAFFIMLYHFTVWESGRNDFTSYLYLIGRHGVSTFYVLSGFTLFYIYHNKFSTLSDSWKYLVKRVFRIYPLLLASQAITLLGFLILEGKIVLDLTAFFLNVSGLYGIFDIQSAYSVGSWSIGNEIFFYIIFPFCVIYFFHQKKKYFKYLLFFISLIIFYYFSFIKLDLALSLTDQWKIYANSVNQSPLFILGMFLSYVYLNIQLTLKPLFKFILISSILALIFFPELPDNSVAIVHGYWRTYFTICISLLIYCSVLKTTESNAWLMKMFRPFIFLGEISYSVYLLHPIVYNSEKILSISSLFSKPLKILIYVSLTILISSISYHHFEKKFIAIAKNIKTII